MAFIGRGREMQALDDLWNTSRAQLLILYGRRRVDLNQFDHDLEQWSEPVNPPTEDIPL